MRYADCKVITAYIFEVEDPAEKYVNEVHHIADGLRKSTTEELSLALVAHFGEAMDVAKNDFFSAVDELADYIAMIRKERQRLVLDGLREADRKMEYEEKRKEAYKSKGKVVHTSCGCVCSKEVKG